MSLADSEAMPDVLCAVIEAAPRVNAMFYDAWLQAAAKAEALWKTVQKEGDFSVLPIEAIPGFGIAATILACRTQNCVLITINDQDDPHTTTTMRGFAIMIALGFFTLTGSRYQMTVPSQEVVVEAVRAAALKIAETVDEEYFDHPELFISAMRRAAAEKWVRRLDDMSERHRCADQEILLGVLNRSSQVLEQDPGAERPPIWDHTKKKTPPWPGGRRF